MMIMTIGIDCSLSPCSHITHQYMRPQMSHLTS